jgi:plastocyanin
MVQLICRFSFLLLLVAMVARASQVHIIRVGYGGNFVFDPQITYANIGDPVVFDFYPSNHSVIRGEYTGSEACGAGGCNPCVPYELIHNGRQGFYSGNFSTQTTSTNENVFSKT